MLGRSTGDGVSVRRAHHVLVVDDGPLNRRLTASILEGLGCTVDLNMGDLDGTAALRKIRDGEAQGDWRTTICALSSDEPAPDSVCFDGYLTKSPSVAELRAVLASLDDIDEPGADASRP